MTDAIDLTKEQRNRLSALLRRFLPGVAVWAYGSRVKWTARPNSDLDLVAFATPAQRPQVADLKEALAESNLPFPVDLHVWDEVPERFREIIRKEYVVVQEIKRPESGSGSLGIAGELPIEYDLRWPVVSLAEIAVKIGSGATPKGGADAYLPSRARFALVRSQNVFDRRFDYDGLAFISDEQADGLRGVSLQPDDILLNITGDGITFGRACMVPKDVLPACVNQHVSIVRLDPQRADAGYVLAFLTHPEVKSYIESFNAGGSRRAVTKGHIESFRLPLPPLPEQRAIAHILGTLDDKIDLNRKMNETLEAMARALFKSWFVDFDPVCAKAEGRNPGLPKPLADLFPDHLGGSPLGHLPKGWEVYSLANKIELLSGGTPKTSDPAYWNGDIPWYSVKDAPSEADVWVIQTEKHITKLGIDNSATQILPEGTTIISARGTVGKLALVGTPMAMNQSCYGVRGIKEHGDYFTYFALRQATADLQQRTHGTVFDTITRQTFETLDCIFPPGNLTQAFDNTVAPLLSKIRANLHQSYTLATLRDTLLPQLLSGCLQINNQIDQSHD